MHKFFHLKLLNMKQISWRRMSVLGVVLMGASAVTAAVLPNKSEARDVTGSLSQANTADGGAAVFSCTATGVVTAPCNVTAGSLTTIGSAANSYTINGFDQTAKNTTTV